MPMDMDTAKRLLRPVFTNVMRLISRRMKLGSYKPQRYESYKLKKCSETAYRKFQEDHGMKYKYDEFDYRHITLNFICYLIDHDDAYQIMAAYFLEEVNKKNNCRYCKSK